MKKVFTLLLLVTTFTYSHAQTWSAVGAAPGGIVSSGDLALCVEANGTDLYIGAMTQTGSKVQYYDGTTVVDLALLTGFPYVVESDGTNLYAGGTFTHYSNPPSAINVEANRIAKWDGTSWTPLGAPGSVGVDAPVFGMEIVGTDVYVGGDFTNAGGSPAAGIAKWDGTSWSSLGTGLTGASGRCNDMKMLGSDLYVGGSFTNAGGVAASHIAKWNGTSWSALGTGANNTVHDIAIDGTDVYIVGAFSSVDGTSASRIAKWNGTSWSALGTGLNGTAHSIESINGELYVFGNFSAAGGVTVNNAAKWDGTSWSSIGTTGLTGGDVSLYDNTSFANGALYVSGFFSNADSEVANSLAQWGPISLPVEWLAFDGQKQANSHILSWSTATEKNNEGFQIERSNNGTTWETLDFIPGAGTTLEIQHYIYTDKEPLSGINYYRLKQIDFNGDYEYSHTITLARTAQTTAPACYPNPFRDQLTIINATGQATLFNALGQPVKTFLIDSPQYQFNTSNLPKGAYTIQVLTPEHELITMQLLK